MMRATLDDVDRVNGIHGGGVDFTGFLADPRTVCLVEGDGMALFGWHGAGLYEVHCHFAQRGREVRDISLRMLDRMRDEFGAERIYAPIPNESRHVKVYVRWLGFRSQGPCPDGELFLREF